MTLEEKKQKKLEKRTKKALRSYKCRPLKNFLWWFTGIICGIIFFISGLVAGVMLIPINTFTGGKNEGVVSEELAQSTLFDIVTNLSGYGVSDLPVLVEALKGVTNGEVGKYIEIDFDKLNNIKFGGSNIAEEVKSCIKIIATIEGTVGTETLGDFGKLSIFTEWEEVKENIDVSAENFNAKLYYYDANNVSSVSTMSAKNGAKYIRAFDDSGNRIAPDGAKIYYAALAKIPVLDALDLIDERVGGIAIIDLLEKLGGAEFDDDSLVLDIFAGKKIKDIGDISADSILVSSVLGGDGSSEIAEILVEALGGKDYMSITLGDLSDLQNSENILDGIKLSTILGGDGTEEFAEIIVDALDGKDYKEITIGDLASLKDNEDLLDTIKLSTVLGGDGTGDLAKILDELVEDKAYAEITLGDLKNIDDDDFSLKDVHLSSVVDKDKIGDLTEILEDIFHADQEGGKKFEDLIIGDLEVLNFEDVHISTVLPSGVNNHVLVEILEDEFGKNYDEIVLKDLNEFEIGKLHLYKVIPEDEIDANLKQIICEITGEDNYKDIYVTDLHAQEGENILDRIKLSTVITSANGNAILEQLIEMETTVGNLGSAIDNLKLCDVYGDNVFKKISGGYVPNGALRFNKSGNTYTMVSSGGTHYLSKEAGMWLFICYTSYDINEDGRALRYVEQDTTLGELQNSASIVSDSFSNATIRQLVDAGIVQSANSHVMKLTLHEVLNATNINN